MTGHPQHRRPDRRGHFRRKRDRDVSRAGRIVGGASRRGCLHATGAGARSGAGAPLLRPAPRGAGGGRAQCGASRAGAARCRMAGRVADRHAECRRPARARGAKRMLHMHGELLIGAVRGLRRAASTGTGDMPPGSVCARLRGARAAPRHRVLRRDAVRDGRDRARAGERRPVRVDRHVGRGLSRRRVRPDRADITARRRWRSTSTGRRAAAGSPRAGAGRRGNWCRRGWRVLAAVSGSRARVTATCRSGSLLSQEHGGQSTQSNPMSR